MSIRIESTGVRLAGAVLVAAAVGTGAAQAANLNVPGVYATIQDAVDVALDGDHVVLSNGTYFENVEIFDKSITLRSASGDPAACIIDGTFTGLRIFGTVAPIDVTVRGITMRDCPTGGMAIEGQASATVRNCVVRECTSNGGIFMNADALRMADCTVRDNASSGNGAGLVIVGGDVTIERTGFLDNESAGNNVFGGGLYVGGDAPLVITDSRFLRNTATGVAGGWGRGGGLGAQGGTTEPILVANTIFDDNTASERGGAIYIEYRSATLVGVSVTNNVGEAGGGMFLENTGGAPADYLVSNALVADNETTNGSGGGIRVTRDATLTVTSATIFHNTANGSSGGGVANGQDSDAALTNCIVGGNTPDDLAGAGTRTVTYSDIETGLVGTGNIQEAPLFVDLNAGDYRLTASSPCIDAGNSAALVAPGMDLDGNHRVVDDPDTQNTGLALVNGAIDMGAYEYQPDVCSQDVTGDGEIGFADLLEILSTWGPCP